MSLHNGSYECDRCGADVGNGGVDRAVVISDATETTDGLTPRMLHLCRDRFDSSGKKVQGCRDRVLTKKALRHHHEKRGS